MRNKFTTGVAIALGMVALVATTTWAGTTGILYDDGTPSGVTLTTPNTYAACPTGTASDTIYTTGVGSRQLRGFVIVTFVTDGGRVPVPGGTYYVNQTGDLNLTVFYPAVSAWPVLASGTREIHVDVQLELYENGFKVATLGPGNDWDLFCLNGPPPPPPGGQGCTPGYWKQPQHFNSYPAPYTPSTGFRAAFGIGPTITLLQALRTNGGGEGALLRHAAAALLNARSGRVNYFYTEAGVIALVQQAYANNSFEPIKNLLEMPNERGCPLN
jgi:hypothetical protein